MQDSKLIEIFRSFNTKELSRFDAYVRSPFFNKNQKVIRLFEIIKSDAPTFNSTKLNKEKVFKKMFPEKRQIDSSLRALMSHLNKLVEDFLVFIDFEKSQPARHIFLLKSLSERRLSSIFDKRLKQAQSHLKKKEKEDSDYFYYQWQLADIAFQNVSINDNRSLKSGFQNALDQNFLFVWANQLRYAVAAKNRQRIIGKSYTLHLPDDFFADIESKQIEAATFTRFYHSLYLMLTDEAQAETHFVRLKQLFIEERDALTPDETRNITTFLSNFCSRKIKEGKNEYYKELFFFYKQMLETGGLLIGRYFSTHYYKNIATVALRLKEYAWAKDFIEDFHEKIDPQFREGIYNYNLAVYHYYTRDYDNARMRLLFTDLIDPFYYTSHKTLLIKTFYELEEDETLHSTVEAFRIYIMRDKAMSPMNKKAFKNFINLVKKLIRIKLGGNKSGKVLKSEIEKTSQVAERQWLLEKAEELI